MLNEHIKLTGKTALVTGASRGIGEAAVKRLSAAGANVVLIARSKDAIETLAREVGEGALALQCDVADWHSVDTAFKQACDKFGSIDILVNNAGVVDPVARMADADPVAWGGVVDINLKGVFHAIRACLPSMQNNNGIIINLSSGAATNALEGWSHYCSTKAAVLSLTTCVHKEYADAGVRCVGLTPGTVATDMQKVIAKSGINPVSQLAWEDHISPDMVAEAILWLCTDAARDYDGGDFSLKSDEGRKAIGWMQQS